MSIALVQLAAERALELRARIGPFDIPIAPAGASQAHMITALRAAELDMLVTLMLVPEADRQTLPICGHWTVTELTGHLADWDAYFLDAITGLEGGIASKQHWVDDIEAMNLTLATMRSAQPGIQNWEDFRSLRLQLMDTLERLNPAHFMRSIDGGRYPSLYHLAWSALEHYLDHAAGVRRELGLKLPERLLAFKGPYT